jgi:hypothetical protein
MITAVLKYDVASCTNVEILQAFFIIKVCFQNMAGFNIYIYMCIRKNDRNKNYIHDNIKEHRGNSLNSCFYSILNISYSTNLKINTEVSIISPIVLCE